MVTVALGARQHLSGASSAYGRVIRYSRGPEPGDAHVVNNAFPAIVPLLTGVAGFLFLVAPLDLDEPVARASEPTGRQQRSSMVQCASDHAR